jgi:glycosyltransferase involved in cell wall biosynthesis
MVKLIVMIPAYNEESTISNVIKKIPRELKRISEIKVLVTDDGSTDKTIEVSKKAGADYIVTAHRNQGLGRNFKKGVEACLKLKADIIVNIDADGQFNPLDITKLIKPILDKKAEMVTASRFSNGDYAKAVPFMKRVGNWGFSKLVSKVSGEKFSDTQCGFRAYSREAALRLNLYSKFTYTQEVFIDLVSKGIKIKAVPLPVKYFNKRKSAISGKLISYGFRSLAIIANASRDTRPMDFFGRPGFTLFGLGFLGGLVSFFYWLTHLMTTPIRTLFNVSVFLMVFGLLLIIFGLLADMLRRVKLTQEETLYRLKKKEYS